MEIEKWKNTGNELMREFVFESQTKLAEFVLLVARFSDEVDHHADMEVYACRKLKLSITTHDEGELTERDRDWVIMLEERIKKN